MKSKTNLYIGIGFGIFGLVQAIDNKIDEAALYLILSGAFTITWFSMKEDLDPEWKKILVRISWALIACSLFWFLYLVRTDAWR